MSRQGANLPRASITFLDSACSLANAEQRWVHATADLPVLCASRAFQIIAAACHKLIHGVTDRYLTCTVTWKPSGSWALISVLAGFFFFSFFCSSTSAAKNSD